MSAGIWCVALDQHPGDLLIRAMNSVTGAEHSSKAPECGVPVDVFALAHSDDPQLRAASRWATALIKHRCAGESALVVLDEYAMTQLVRASGVARPDLVRALHRVAYTPPT